MFERLSDTFFQIAHDPPLGLAFATLFALTGAWGLVLGVGERYGRAPRPGSRQWEEKPVAATFAIVTLLIVTMLLWVSFATLGIVRLLGGKTSFEAVFCLLVFDRR